MTVKRGNHTAYSALEVGRRSIHIRWASFYWMQLGFMAVGRSQILVYCSQVAVYNLGNERQPDANNTLIMCNSSHFEISQISLNFTWMHKYRQLPLTYSESMTQGTASFWKLSLWQDMSVTLIIAPRMTLCLCYSSRPSRCCAMLSQSRTYFRFVKTRQIKSTC